MKRQQVVSSNINSVGYDPETQTLEVEFYTGVIYQYSPVTEEAKNQMLSSESIGSYFAKNIKNNKEITQTKV